MNAIHSLNRNTPPAFFGGHWWHATRRHPNGYLIRTCDNMRLSEYPLTDQLRPRGLATGYFPPTCRYCIHRTTGQ